MVGGGGGATVPLRGEPQASKFRFRIPCSMGTCIANGRANDPGHLEVFLVEPLGRGGGEVEWWVVGE